jgi:hypothetical protein
MAQEARHSTMSARLAAAHQAKTSLTAAKPCLDLGTRAQRGEQFWPFCPSIARIRLPLTAAVVICSRKAAQLP